MPSHRGIVKKKVVLAEVSLATSAAGIVLRQPKLFYFEVLVK